MMNVCNLVTCATTSNPNLDLGKITKNKKEEEKEAIEKITKPSHMVYAIFENL